MVSSVRLEEECCINTDVPLFKNGQIVAAASQSYEAGAASGLPSRHREDAIWAVSFLLG